MLGCGREPSGDREVCMGSHGGSRGQYLQRQECAETFRGETGDQGGGKNFSISLHAPCEVNGKMEIQGFLLRPHVEWF